MRPSSTTLAILLLLAALPAMAKPTSLPPPIIPDCVGVNIHFTGQPQKDLDGLESGGFGWIRMDFEWASIEKTKGVYDFSQYDSLLAGLTARHIRPLFILDYGNPLYEADSPSTPEARAAFARFAAAAAAHYRGKTILWEIWNEPNGGFWHPNPDVSAYGALALSAAHAIHATDPNATVLAPASSGIPLDYLESLFKQGLLQDIDAVSLHPYRSSNPETATQDYAAVRRLIHQYAPPGKDIPLVCSEWGYTTVNVSELQQAQYLTREWLSNLADGVRLSIWYDWHDDGTVPTNGEHHFGTVRNDYVPKPSFLAARTLTHTLNGYRFIKRIPLASPNDYLLLFSHGAGPIKLAAWTTGPDHDILLPIPHIESLTDMSGSAVTPTVAHGLLRLTLAQSPIYLSASDAPALREAAAWTAAPSPAFYTATHPINLTLTYHNPDTRPHRIQFLTLATTAQGQRTTVPGGSDIVAPGQTLTEGAQTAAFAHVNIRVRVGLKVDGVLQPYPQDIAFMATDPISLAVWPMGDNKTTLAIENISGNPFHGTISATGSAASANQAITISAGQSQLEIPWNRPAGDGYLLRDTHGVIVARTPSETFVPYPLPMGPLVPTLDGDLKVPSTAECTHTGDTEQIHYDFRAGWSFLRESEAAPPPLAGQPLAYGVWVDGDNSGNQINIRWQDSTGQTFQVGGPRLDWSGWRFLTFSLQPNDASHWGGANDGHLHGSVSLNTLLLVDSLATARHHAGTISWKEPTIIYSQPPGSAQKP
jgi:hypothetical protein